MSNIDYKVILRDIVELFYHTPFKIFNINSVDGETMTKPFGYFISLGITTSLESLKQLRDVINRSDYGFTSRLVEIQSKKSEEYGDYLNTVSEISEEDIEKYESELPQEGDGIELYNKEEALELLKDLQQQISLGDFRVSPLKSRIQEVMARIENWSEFLMQIKDGVPGVYHKYVNYKKAGDIEYRIGIYATKL